MPPSGQTTVNRGHIWSKYELDILMCLMARGVHRGGVSGSHVLTDDEKRVAHRDVHRRLNREAHLNNRARYVSLAEVTTMIDRVLAEQSGIVGVNGFIETATPNRVTRGLRSVWGRATRTMARDNQFAITYQQRPPVERPRAPGPVQRSIEFHIHNQDDQVIRYRSEPSHRAVSTLRGNGHVPAQAQAPRVLPVNRPLEAINRGNLDNPPPAHAPPVNLRDRRLGENPRAPLSPPTNLRNPLPPRPVGPLPPHRRLEAPHRAISAPGRNLVNSPGDQLPLYMPPHRRLEANRDISNPGRDLGNPAQPSPRLPVPPNRRIEMNNGAVLSPPTNLADNPPSARAYRDTLMSRRAEVNRPRDLVANRAPASPSLRLETNNTATSDSRRNLIASPPLDSPTLFVPQGPPFETNDTAVLSPRRNLADLPPAQPLDHVRDRRIEMINRDIVASANSAPGLPPRPLHPGRPYRPNREYTPGRRLLRDGEGHPRAPPASFPNLTRMPTAATRDTLQPRYESRPRSRPRSNSTELSRVMAGRQPARRPRSNTGPNRLSINGR